MGNNDLYEIEVEYVYQTENAILVNDGDVDVWLPKSKIVGFDEDEKHREGDCLVLEIPEWLAIEKELD